MLSPVASMSGLFGTLPSHGFLLSCLQEEGYATHAIFVYSFPQAAAAAQAGVSVLQVSMGRTRSWYQTHPGVVRDPYG